MGKKSEENVKKIICFLFLASCFLLLSSCAHPVAEGKDKIVSTLSQNFDADANTAYSAIRWALKTSGYAINSEDLQNGIITSGWLAGKADSFYVAPFGHKDYGVNGAYYRLEFTIIPEGGETKIEISSRVKSVLAHLKSSEIEEKKILKKIGDYLRNPEIRVTNVGIEE